MTKMRLLPAAVVAGALVVATGAAPPVGNAATAYTVEPLNLNLAETTPTLFNGAICDLYRCVTVPTEAALDPSHADGVLGEDGPIADGASTLDVLLVGDDGEKLVLGYSQGAQIAGFWLRNFAATTAVDRATTSFLLVGDPENTYGVPWAPDVPADTGFEVTEVWAQYDGWADWPNRFDLLANANAIYGMLFVHPIVYNHLDLAVEEANGNVIRWKDGDVTYKMIAERDLPILDPLRNIGLGWVADIVNESWRAHIEEQYDRPSTQDEADALYGIHTEHQAGAGIVVSAIQPLAELVADSRSGQDIQFDPEPAVSEQYEQPITTDLVGKVRDAHMVVGTRDDSDEDSERVDATGEDAAGAVSGSEDVSPDPPHSDSEQDESSASLTDASTTPSPAADSSHDRSTIQQNDGE